MLALSLPRDARAMQPGRPAAIDPRAFRRRPRTARLERLAPGLARDEDHASFSGPSPTATISGTRMPDGAAMSVATASCSTCSRRPTRALQGGSRYASSCQCRRQPLRVLSVSTEHSNLDRPSVSGLAVVLGAADPLLPGDPQLSTSTPSDANASCLASRRGRQQRAEPQSNEHPRPGRGRRLREPEMQDRAEDGGPEPRSGDEDGGDHPGRPHKLRARDREDRHREGKPSSGKPQFEKTWGSATVQSLSTMRLSKAPMSSTTTSPATRSRTGSNDGGRRRRR